MATTELGQNVDWRDLARHYHARSLRYGAQLRRLNRHFVHMEPEKARLAETIDDLARRERECLRNAEA